MIHRSYRAVTKTQAICNIQGLILSSYIGIVQVISHHKHPYEPISIMKCHVRVLNAALINRHIADMGVAIIHVQHKRCETSSFIMVNEHPRLLTIGFPQFMLDFSIQPFMFTAKSQKLGPVLKLTL